MPASFHECPHAPSRSSSAASPLSCCWLRVMTILALTGTVSMLVWLFWTARHGLDFTDEGYYLVHMARPFAYPIISTQFAFFYHPLYLLVQGDTVLLRQINILLTFVPALVLAWSILRRFGQGLELDASGRVALCGAFACGAFMFSAFISSTPSYNFLAGQGMLWAMCGLLLCGKENTPVSVGGWLLLGLGGWMTFMGKPSSCALLGLLIFLHLCLSRTLDIKLGLSLLTFAVLFWLSATAISGSVGNFIRELAHATLSDVLRQSDASHLFHLQVPSVGKRLWVVGLSASACLGLAAFLLRSKDEKRGMAVVAGMGASALALLLLLESGALSIAKRAHDDIGLTSLSLLAGTIAAGFFWGRRRSFAGWPLSRWSLLALFVLLPFAFACGSTNSHWFMAAFAAVFWALAALLMALGFERGPRLAPFVLLLGLAVQVLVATAVAYTVDFPYRQPVPLRLQTHRIEAGPAGAPLFIAPQFGAYLEDIGNKAAAAGLRPGDQMLDLTGISPFVPYYLGAMNTGLAWLAGGKATSELRSVRAVDGLPCDVLASSWLLAEPGVPRAPALLPERYGADMESDFILVAEIQPVSLTHFRLQRNTQQLRKPVRALDEAVRACEQKRREKGMIPVTAAPEQR